jgi:hypothetical protein
LYDHINILFLAMPACAATDWLCYEGLPVHPVVLFV